ncbi:hypothetical protein IGI96_003856 [Enterococcus sp. DIV0421]
MVNRKIKKLRLLVLIYIIFVSMNLLSVYYLKKTIIMSLNTICSLLYKVIVRYTTKKFLEN